MEGCLPGCREGIRQGIPCGQASTLILEWLWSFPSSPLWWGTSANAGPYARTHLPRTTQGRGPSPAGDRGGQHDQRPTTGSSPKYQNPTVSQFLGLTKDEEEKPQQVWTSSACPPHPQALQLPHDPLCFLAYISFGWVFLVWGFSC